MRGHLHTGARRGLPDRRFRRALRIVGWNALLIFVGVALTALAGEAWFRLTMPFIRSPLPLEFVPKVGHLRPPNTEVRHTNRFDYWTVSRTNSLGFLDREPPSPERAAASCHVAIIGDSSVEALQVPIEDKLQVRLEELAASRSPHLDVTTSAFGLGNTGQVQQLPFYDEYARRLHPELLVLVFVDNDFVNNAPLLRLAQLGKWRRRLEPTVNRRPDGELESAWRLPQDPLPSVSPTPKSWAARAMEVLEDHSWFAFWLRTRKNTLYDLLRSLGYMKPGPASMSEVFARRDLPPLFEEALEYTRFALEQFRQRADRDGAALVILASTSLKTDGRTHTFERLSEMAATLGIPVIDQVDYILRQGAELTDARWPRDPHWNPAGHQWAAEALLEYIEQRPEICDG